MTAPAIGIDVDGVLANFDAAYARLIMEMTGKKVDLPPKTWNYAKDQVGLTDEELEKLDTYISENPFWRASMPALVERATFRRLNHIQYGKSGYDLYFITSRRGTYVKEETEDWLRGRGIGRPTVLISHNKGPVVWGLNLAFFLDDKPENCADVVRCSPSTEVFLLDASHNRWDFVHRRLFSVDQWLDIVEEKQREQAA